MAKKKQVGLQSNSWISWAIFAFLLIDAVALLFLYVWSFYTSFKTPTQFLANQLWPSFPWTWKLDNYKKAYTLFESYVLTDTGYYKIGLINMLINTLFLIVLSTVPNLLSKYCMSYVMGRFQGRHIKFIMAMYLFLMMVPIVGNTASSIKFWKVLGLYDSWGMILVGAIPFFDMNFLIMHSIVKGVGKELVEAAKIDGASEFRVQWQIMFPQVANIIAILALYAVIGGWNNYMTTVVLMPSYPTLAYGVYSFSVSISTGASLPPVQMAGSMLLALPMIIVFIAFKEKILGGISFSISK